MNPPLMTILLLAGLVPFSWTAWRRWRLLRVAAGPVPPIDAHGQRLRRVLRYVFGQERMFRYRWAGWAHAAIFAGFLVLLLRSLILYARGYASDPHFGFGLFDDGRPAGRAYLLAKDLIGLAVIAGVAYFLYLRLGPRPARMEHGAEGYFILLMILGIILADLLYEAGGYALADAPASRRAITPAAALLSLLVDPLPDGVHVFLRQLGFWAHAVIVLAFLNFLPYGKHFHILTVLPNVYLAPGGPPGRLRPIDDIEQRIERGQTLGVRRARDLSWKAVLDLYTCTECGRCSDHCPATRTGKLLSPKHLTLALRDHMYRNERALLGPALHPHSGPVATAAGQSADGSSVSVAGFVRPDGTPDATGGDLVPDWVDPETLWACTTCLACETECPVFISYVDKIVDLRRHLVMERGEFPPQLQTAFRGLETVGNVYSFANERRADWAEGLNVPLLSDRPGAEILYWVGCSPSFDDRARRIARAMARLLNHAGVDFAILGPLEQCTGDPARRAGNEYLFQTLARANVETLNGHQVRRIVTTCPHCFNTLRNEYPDFGGRYEVVHHTELLLELLRQGRLRPVHPVPAVVAYHDSCYLGRYHGIYDAPREILRAIPGLRAVDPPESRDRGMCCGAGGAQMWKEEEPVRRQSTDARGRVERPGKVNHARAHQLLRVLPAPGPTAGSPAPGATAPTAPPSRCVASACPFCMTMLTDALRDQGHTDVGQLDVAEILLQSVFPPEGTAPATPQPGATQHA